MAVAAVAAAAAAAAAAEPSVGPTPSPANACAALVTAAAPASAWAGVTWAVPLAASTTFPMSPRLTPRASALDARRPLLSSSGSTMSTAARALSQLAAPPPAPPAAPPVKAALLAPKPEPAPLSASAGLQARTMCADKALKQLSAAVRVESRASSSTHRPSSSSLSRWGKTETPQVQRGSRASRAAQADSRSRHCLDCRRRQHRATTRVCARSSSGTCATGLSSLPLAAAAAPASAPASVSAILEVEAVADAEVETEVGLALGAPPGPRPSSSCPHSARITGRTLWCGSKVAR
mmetsp:Transcript_9239/g.20416  ORF Transcript_9239/g.20416 Transcript_9239/m.20416 type:complete len:293 (-) Transcript_9239:2780-3658(-)